MANVIKSFLIGIGLDTTDFDKGSKNVETSLSRIRSVSGFAGTAIVGAFGAASAAALKAGDNADKLVLATERFNTSSRFVYDYGNALKTLGGSSDDATQAIAATEKALDELRLKGSFSAFDDAVFAGVDTSKLTQAQSGEEMLRMLSDMVPNLNKAQQRVLQDNFGFSNATMRSLREGSANFDRIVQKADGLANGFDAAAEAGRKYNQELAETGQRLDGISNSLASKMLPSFTAVLSSLNQFIDKNKPGVESAINTVGNSPVGSALVAGGGALGVAGGALKAIGMKGLGATISRLGLPGLAIGGGMMAWDINQQDMKNWGINAPDWLFKTPKELWNSRKDTTRSDQLDYIHNNIVSGTDAASTSSDLMRGGNISSPSTPSINNNLDIKLQMDGKDIETKVVGVLQRRDQATIDDVKTTTDR